jgi:hypothetical protein
MPTAAADSRIDRLQDSPILSGMGTEMFPPQGRTATGVAARASGAASAADIACTGLFLLLLALNVARTLRHAMWRDELQIFQLGTASGSLTDLFRHLRYEAHAGFWDAMVFAVTRVTADPADMQVLQALLAAAIWIVIYRWSPFARTEKFLLLLGYFLFFEYFVMSRSYTLAALLGFGFVAIRHHAPQRTILAWLALGLLANLVMHATIWSIALAIGFAIEQRRRDAAFCVGAAIYLALMAFGIGTMIPEADYAPWGRDVDFSWQRLYNAVAIPVGAFWPIDPDWVKDSFRFVTGATDVAPKFWNPLPIIAVVSLAQANLDHPLRLALVFAAPLALCWRIVRRPLRVLEFAIAYGGIVAFATLWDFVGSAHHHGMLYLALISGAWLARARSGSDGWAVWALRFVLLVNAVGGVLTLASETHPFSQSRNASRWLVDSKFADAFLIGSRDAQASSVAGYLGRPIYYLECQCQGTFITWNEDRQSPLSAEQFRTRLSRALDLAAGRTAILIRNRPLSADEPAGLAVTPLTSFTGAETDENYWIYRVAKP